MNIRCKILGHGIPKESVRYVEKTQHTIWIICKKCEKRVWIHPHDYDGYYIEEF